MADRLRSLLFVLALMLLFSFPALGGQAGAGATPACAACANLRVAPLDAFTPFVMVDDGKPYEVVAPWRGCQKCNAGLKADRLADGLRARLAAASKAKAQWEERTKAELTLVATPYLSIYTQARPQQVRSYALQTEKLVGHLQKQTGSMTLTRTRSDSDVILLLSEPRSYKHFVDEMAKRQPDQGWAQCLNSSGGVDRHIAFSNLARSGASADHHIVFLFGQMLMHEATDQKAPPWLREGFAAYCERAVFHQNLFSSSAYKENRPRLEPHWPRAMRMALQKGEKVSLRSVIGLDMSGAGAGDYLGCFSVVSYLLDAHPKPFLKFVLLLRAGEPVRKALEMAYGRTIDELDAEWRTWAMNLGKL